MDEGIKQHVGKILYGSLFCIAIPALLALWSMRLDALHAMPSLQRPTLGASLMTVGALMMALAMESLWRRGGGLPMNAFPPPRHVVTGLYMLAPHPIYYGFTLLCAGASLRYGSAAGLWITTPFVGACCAALVLGHELPDLRERFGANDDSVWLPRPGAQKPRWRERFRLYFTVLTPWLLIYEGLQHLGPRLGTRGSTFLPCESSWPVITAWEPIYSSIYLLIIFAPLLLRSADALRRFASLSLRAMALLFPLYALLPYFVPPRPYAPGAETTIFYTLQTWERTPVSGGAAFPSFHVVWALIAAESFCHGRRWLRCVTYLYAAAVAVGCILTGMHSLIDVLAGATAFLVILAMPTIWRAMLSGCERVANSWREWRFGALRVINHGGWAALATLVVLLIIAALLGEHGAILSACIYFFATVGAALWAQWVEGSPSLLRPLGFYGGMIGSILGALVALPLGLNLWTALAAICMGSAWMQAIGRLRCLVQGCCHGAATHGAEGIHYHHPRTRVCRLSDLGGRTVHATQLYSMLCCAVTGLAMLRHYTLGASATTLCAAYLILSGLGRFVEEAYRGEPQTLVACSLRLYQWIAIFTIALGAVIS